MSAQLTWRALDEAGKARGRQRLARLFFRKRWLFRVKRSFGLAICIRSDTKRYNSMEPVPKKEIPGNIGPPRATILRDDYGAHASEPHV
jgi:hypothetical protein